MTHVESHQPVLVGEAAPDFTLPAVHRDGTVSLADYRDRTPLLLAIFPGLWCPFCRRAIVQFGLAGERLQALGVETLGVVATTAENARLYFRFRPTRVPLGADPELITHKAYGLPKPAVTPELMRGLEAVRVNPTGELPEPLPPVQASEALSRLDGFQPTATDRDDAQRQFPQLKGQFLMDREGIVRWADIECAKEGLAGVGKFPTEEEFVAAARGVAG